MCETSTTEPSEPISWDREKIAFQVGMLEAGIKHTATKSELEKATGTMREGIAEAIGKMETNLAKVAESTKTDVAVAKTDIANAKVWALLGAIAIIGSIIGSVLYLLSIISPFFKEIIDKL